MIRTFNKFMLVFVILAGCRMAGDDQADNVSKEDFDKLKAPGTERTIYYRFPSPEEMLRYIHQEKLAFQEELVNPVNNSAQYIDSKSQSINLGIYISDLAYATIFRKLNLASDYLGVVQRLSDALHIKYMEETEVKDRVQQNLANLDSLMSISRESYNFMVDYLVETNNEKTLALISAGAYIEALYLALNQISVIDTNDEILRKVLEQKYAFGNLYKYMLDYTDFPQIQEVIAELDDIQEVFEEVQFKQVGKAELEREGGELVLTGSKKTLIFDQATVKRLTAEVNALRNKFVQDL